MTKRDEKLYLETALCPPRPGRAAGAAAAGGRDCRSGDAGPGPGGPRARRAAAAGAAARRSRSSEPDRDTTGPGAHHKVYFIFHGKVVCRARRDPTRRRSPPAAQRFRGSDHGIPSPSPKNPNPAGDSGGARDPGPPRPIRLGVTVWPGPLSRPGIMIYRGRDYLAAWLPLVRLIMYNLKAIRVMIMMPVH
jgi:hypothetical protein